MRKDTIEVGDIVQIRAVAKHHAGRVGRVIGSRFVVDHFGDGQILYTVQFSDTEAAEYDGHKFKIIRSTLPHESGTKDITYETR